MTIATHARPPRHPAGPSRRRVAAWVAAIRALEDRYAAPVRHTPAEAWETATWAARGGLAPPALLPPGRRGAALPALPLAVAVVDRASGAPRFQPPAWPRPALWWYAVGRPQFDARPIAGWMPARQPASGAIRRRLTAQVRMV